MASVGADGSRVYSVGYFAGGRWKRYTIGRVGDLTLAGAREAARQIRARARLGEDPQAEKVSERQAGQTFGDLIGLFVQKHGPRVYTNEEIRATLRQCPGQSCRTSSRCSFARPSESEEARAARWADFDADRAFWTIPAAVTKAGDPHPVPLSSGAMRVVARTREPSGAAEFLFPAPTGVCRGCGRAGHMDVPNKAITRLRRVEGVPRDFRLHDVRRTVATRLAEMGTLLSGRPRSRT